MRKKIAAIVVGLLIGVGGWWISLPPTTLATPQAAPTPGIIARPEDRVEIPQKLAIPKLKLVTAIEAVGEDINQRMAVPTNPANAGWWERGPRPGERGSAVLDGHVDLPGGKPGIFASLGQLSPGDMIEITDQGGKTWQFRVTEVTIYLDKDFPLERVFARNDQSRLNLITCAGTYDRREKNYTKRLVVYAVRLEKTSELLQNYYHLV